MTVDAFFAAFAGVDARWELVDGCPIDASGRTLREASIIANVLTALHTRLCARGCLVFGSRVGLFIDDNNLRYPDVAVYCDPRDTEADPFTTPAGRHPRVLVVVFGPDGPALHDARRIEQYRGIGSLQAILVVHSATSEIESLERADRVWRTTSIAAGASIPLPCVDQVLAFEEVFGDRQ